ncbi:probable phospholipid hydroperoxide glutathione peroxidase isoform X2 [Sipha flava]|uniref:Probable phospholipid hydroperoxide glutathione peroxidase isoform X2 n=1 Tax=Sipha flava TaxID=143950 RepID=A0A8B8FJT7_9HEMI|nr:probable phospholipid hydroperoxide glutathione peroxidase isoform X2 [Sipha flava]
MSCKRVLTVLVLVTALPAVLSFNLHILETLDSLKLRLTKKIYDFDPVNIYGERIPLAILYGSPMIIVNIPFDCDAKRIFVLNDLMARYSEDGLKILAFPTDEFSPKYPLDQFTSPSVIRDWVNDNQLHFMVFYKIFVNGKYTHPLWKYLKSTFDLYDNDINEDYTMFLVDKSGKPVERIPGTPWLSTEE